jgi:5-methylcytosine-specific restriction endonuclease McrA
MDRGGKKGMIRVAKAMPPKRFETICRKPGLKWLKDNRGYKRPLDLWSAFESELRKAFNGLCGYCAMLVMKGQIDHFIPIDLLRDSSREHLIYQWSNFRYAEGVLNQRKSNHRVLDPYKVKNEWFKLLLPSLQLVLTEHVPKNTRKLAEFTLTQLGLRDSEVVIRYREKWFRLYREMKLTLEGLNEIAPLIAIAVKRDLAAGKDWRV